MSLGFDQHLNHTLSLIAWYNEPPYLYLIMLVFPREKELCTNFKVHQFHFLCRAMDTSISFDQHLNHTLSPIAWYKKHHPTFIWLYWHFPERRNHALIPRCNNFTFCAEPWTLLSLNIPERTSTCKTVSLIHHRTETVESIQSMSWRHCEVWGRQTQHNWTWPTCSLFKVLSEECRHGHLRYEDTGSQPRKTSQSHTV